MVEQVTPAVQSYLQHKEVAFATGKELTLMQAIALWGLNSDNVTLVDPEAETQVDGITIPEAVEPMSTDPLDAVKHKMERAKLTLGDKAADITIFTGDVIPRIQYPQESKDTWHYFHRFDRVPEDEFDEPQFRSEVDRRYGRQNFTVQWLVGFGVHDQGETRYGKLIVEAKCTELNPREIQRLFDPQTSPGIKLLEAVHQQNHMKLELKFSEDAKQGLTISYEMSHQLIVDKIPSIEMLEQLIPGVWSENPAVGQGILLSLAN